MSDTEAKLDEQNVDNGMQEAEAKKEDVNVDVENADNEIEVEKKQDESDATPIVNKSAGKRPATPPKDKDNSARLAAMKVKLKAELKKQTEVVVPKKKHQDFLGLGYKTKESKALEDTVTS